MHDTCPRCGLFHPSAAPCLALSQQTTTTPADLQPDILLAKRYRIIRQIHRGGMSVIYLADDTKMQGRQVALKELRQPDGASDEEIQEAEAWFARESALLSVLRHPLIPAFYSVFRENGRSYIAQEYVPGNNLEDLVNRQGPVEPGAARAWALSLCQLLEYLHGLPEPVIFRDLKPANILQRTMWNAPERRLAVVDFGIARPFQQDTIGTVIGTPGYAPPEQYQGLATPQSDIYALGATLHRLLTGYNPEQGTQFTFPPVQSLNPKVPAPLAAVVARATALNPADRYQSAGEMRNALRALSFVKQRTTYHHQATTSTSAQRVMVVIAAMLMAPLLLSQMSTRFALHSPFSGTPQVTLTEPMQSNPQPVVRARPSNVSPQNGILAVHCTTPQGTSPASNHAAVCGPDRSYWLVHKGGSAPHDAKPGGMTLVYKIPAPANVLTTITPGPGNSPAADGLWITGSTNTVVYFTINGRPAVYHVPVTQSVVPLRVDSNGSLHFRAPNEGLAGVITSGGQVTMHYVAGDSSRQVQASYLQAAK
ncbi:MAG: serine/threonine protein kinase [Chloroflexi bacterium]|nr:serine/threonine protein kinase [Chloroflexota bacterium]